MSLRSIALKGRFYRPDHMSRESMKGFCEYVYGGLMDRRTKLINAQSIWNDMVPPVGDRTQDDWERLIYFAHIPRPKPPFEKIWLEAIVLADDRPPQQRIGAMIMRLEGWEKIRSATITFAGEDQELITALPEEVVRQLQIDQPETFVNALICHEWEGSVAPTGNCFYWLDHDGNFQWSCRVAVLGFREDQPVEQKEITYARMRIRQGWIMHTFARMNCANATLVPISDGRRHHRNLDQAPSSVWHEIKIGNAPKIRRNGAAAAEAGEESSMRFHWIRGHYADYSKGNGLFGNPKLRKVFWIQDHTAGKEELGSVISSYQVN